MKPTSAAAFGCGALVCLPFIGIGVGATVIAVSRYTAGDRPGATALAFFGFVFAFVGIGAFVAIVAGRRERRRREQREEGDPESPWLWREDWAAGRVRDANRSAAASRWTFALMWNLVALPAAWFGVRDAITKDKPAAALVLLFPAVGLGLIVAAARASMRSRKFGASRLDLATTPGAIGQGLGGVIRTPADIRSPDGFRLLLSCVQVRRTGSGKSRSTHETVLWQEEKRVSGQRGAGGPEDGMVTNIPVAFRIPPAAAPCDDRNPDNRVVWRLRASASVPGVDYESMFEVPVFRTTASDAPPMAETERLLGRAPSAAGWRQPADSPIRVTTTAGATEVLFPAGRNRGAALGVTLCAAIWGAVVTAVFVLDAPLIFKLVCALVEALIVYAVLRLWFRVVRVTANRERLSVAAGFGTPGEPRTLSAAEVGQVEVRVGMQSGERVWYDLYVVRPNGKTLQAGGGIRDKREAEWIAARLREALGQAPVGGPS
ncbi:MAG: hypothetical protein ACREOC_00010 [Gemmatimonadales bacterium]